MENQSQERDKIDHGRGRKERQAKRREEKRGGFVAGSLFLIGGVDYIDE